MANSINPLSTNDNIQIQSDYCMINKSGNNKINDNNRTVEIQLELLWKTTFIGMARLDGKGVIYVEVK